LHAIGEDGTVRWKYAAGGAIRSEPVIIRGHVYVSSDDGFTARLDTHGKEEWRARTDAVAAARLPPTDEKTRWDRYGSAVVTDGKRVFYASRDHNLYALDIDTGATLWKFMASDIMTATPALYRDLVLIADYAGKVQALGKGRARRWTMPPMPGFATSLLLSATLSGD
jgi:outer membrane protein assembly factor BamB